MTRRLLFFFACLLLSRPLSYSQAVCGFDAVHAQKLSANGAYATQVQQSINNWVGNKTLGGLSKVIQTANGPVYEIPVVIHVIRPNASPAIDANTNPSDAQLMGMITYLNQSYAAQFPGYPDTNNGGTAFPIRFVLAKRDPNCSATSGILRIDGSGLTNYVSGGITTDPANNPGEDDAVVKALSTWPVSRYYNIYIVHKIDGQNTTTGPFTAGYAYFPNGNYTDATVMLASVSKSGEKTLPHEIGHAFSLFHTFQGDNGGASCPTAGNCNTSGDLVCDTDPHIRSQFNCQPAAINTCTGTPIGNLAYNFMDYSSCTQRLFTPGQRERFMFSVLNDRPGLAFSLGGVAPPAAATTAATCNPTVVSPAGTLNAGPVEVSFAGIFSQSRGGYVTDGNVVYSDLTCAYTGNVKVGTTYPISILTTSPNSKVRAWIDLNNDGVFANPGEQIFNVGNGPSNTFTGTWTVPSTIATCTPLRMRVIVDRTTSTNIGPCAVLLNGQAEDYTIIARPATDTPVIALSSTSTNPSCSGTPLTFIVAPPPTAINPTYSWYVNNTLQTSSGTSFTTSTAVNGDVVRCWVRYAGACGADSAFSNSITIIRGTNVVASVGLTLTVGSNPGCPGQSLTFTATGVNGGINPVYAFRVNGVTVQSGVSNTFSTTSLNNGDVVTVRMTTNSSCAQPALTNSNPIQYVYGVVNAGVTVAQTAGNTPACDGKPVTFTATPTNGGTAPSFVWLVNGTLAQTGSGPSFTYQPANGDVVTVVLTSSNVCATKAKDTSAPVTLTVVPSVTPAVSISLTRGSNPGCRDSLLEFTAVTTGLTNAPVVKWYVNGVVVAFQNPFVSTTLSNGDVVYAVASTNGPGCRTVDSAVSGIISLQVDTPAAPVLISYINDTLVASSELVQWYGPNGKIPGATGSRYRPGPEGYYYAIATNGACPSGPSNILLVSTLTVGRLALDNFVLAPNPTNGSVTLSWNKGTNALVSVEVYNALGMRVATERVEAGVQQKTVSLDAFANGTYFFVLRNGAGEAATAPVVLRR